MAYTYTRQYDYTLKFSPYLYDANGMLKSTAISFKDKMEFKVGYEVSLNAVYWSEVVSQWKNPDLTPIYEKIEDVPLPANNKFLFRASFDAVSDPSEAGYTTEKDGYKIVQPSNGTFVVTTDGKSAGDKTIYIYLVDPHRELAGKDEAFRVVKQKVDVYQGSYDENRNRVVDEVEPKPEVDVEVPKLSNELDEIILSATIKVSGILLPEYTANILVYQDANISDGELEMTLAEGFTTDDVIVTTYPFSLNLVPNEDKDGFVSDLNTVKPGIYQVFVQYKGVRYKLRDLIIKGYNILNGSKELVKTETESEDPEVDPTVTYSYNVNVGESILLTLYSNPITDPKDTRLYIAGPERTDVVLRTIPNAAGCLASAVLDVKEFTDDEITVKAITQLVPKSGKDTAERIIKVIPEVGTKKYAAPEEFPEDEDIKLFDTVTDIFVFAEGRRVFSKNLGTDKNPTVLYQIATNEFDTTSTEYEFINAMIVSEFVKKVDGPSGSSGDPMNEEEGE